MLQRVQTWHLFKSCLRGLKHLWQHQRPHISCARVSCVMPGKAGTVIWIWVHAAFCMNHELCTEHSGECAHAGHALAHWCMCAYMCPSRNLWGFVRMAFPQSWCSLPVKGTQRMKNLVFLCPFTASLPGEVGWLIWSVNLGRISGTASVATLSYFWELCCPLNTWVLFTVSPCSQTPFSVLPMARGIGLPNLGFNFNNSIFLQGPTPCPPIDFH